MMIGIDGRLDLSCLHTSSPLIRGIITSRITRSGESLRARSRPSTPSSAVSTWKPSYSKLSRRPATILGSSSTIKIFVTLMNSPSRESGNLEMAGGVRRSCVHSSLSCRCSDRQRYCELAAVVRDAFQGDIASMRLRNVAHKRQPESRAFCAVHQRISTAVELLENFVLFGGRDSNPAILDFQFDAAVRAVQAHADILLV